jgi:hypothetical protein
MIGGSLERLAALGGTAEAAVPTRVSFLLPPHGQGCGVGGVGGMPGMWMEGVPGELGVAGVPGISVPGVPGVPGV